MLVLVVFFCHLSKCFNWCIRKAINIVANLYLCFVYWTKGWLLIYVTHVSFTDLPTSILAVKYNIFFLFHKGLFLYIYEPHLSENSFTEHYRTKILQMGKYRIYVMVLWKSMHDVYENYMFIIGPNVIPQAHEKWDWQMFPLAL